MMMGTYNKRDVFHLLTDRETKVLDKTSQRNVIRAKINALNFRLIVCTSDKEREEIEEEISLLKEDLRKLQ